MLILDDQTTHLLSAIINSFHSLGVKNITKASLIKKPQPTFTSIYFISPQSIELVVKDFKDSPIYHSINLLICETITP